MIEAVDRLRRTLAAWNETRLVLARLSSEQHGNWRLAIVKTRRTLQEQIGAMTSAMGELGHTVVAEDDFKACRSALATVRARLAMHQSEWPAVKILPEDETYRHSSVALRQANDAFARSADLLLRRLSGTLHKQATKESR